jgi:DNA-directed RNA polymerase subunit M/transcription elongation factor TFIIS
MARATCRCGQALAVPADPSERVVCPKCGARVRIRVKPRTPAADAPPGDGYIRFFCPCGRRLKVDASAPPPHGKCPDCGRVVPVPASSLVAATRPSGHPESPTEELSAVDRAALERWSGEHLARHPRSAATAAGSPVSPPPTDKVEVGLRVCPRCGRPIHLGAANCRNCGTPVPKR